MKARIRLNLCQLETSDFKHWLLVVFGWTCNGFNKAEESQTLMFRSKAIMLGAFPDMADLQTPSFFALCSATVEKFIFVLFSSSWRWCCRRHTAAAVVVDDDVVVAAVVDVVDAAVVIDVIAAIAVDVVIVVAAAQLLLLLLCAVVAVFRCLKMAPQHLSEWRWF